MGGAGEARTVVAGAGENLSLAGTLTGRVLPLNLGRALALGQLECQARSAGRPATGRGPRPVTGRPAPWEHRERGPRGHLCAAHRAGVGPARVTPRVRRVPVSGP